MSDPALAADPLALLARLEAVAARAPGAAAVVTPGARGGAAALTRAELVARARATARGLAACGLRPGDPVLFSVRPGAEALVLMLAVVEAGGVLVAGDPGVGDRVFAARMALVRPRWVMAESLLLAAMASPLLRRVARMRGADLPSAGALAGVRRVRVGPPLPGAMRALTPAGLRRAGAFGGTGRGKGNNLWSGAGRGGDERLGGAGNDAAGNGGAESAAFVVFTSGTTGAPRAVVHTRRSLAATLALVGDRLGAGPGDVVYTRDLHLALPALLAGARVMMPRELGFDPARTLRDLRTHGATHAFLVTADAQTLLDHLAATGAALPPTLRTLLLGAAPVHAEFLRRLQGALPAGAEAWAVYGMTELLPAAAVTLADKLAWADAGGAGDLLGAPMPGVAARLTPEGELVLRGPNLCAGDLAALRAGAPPVAEHATGDLARVEPDGRLVLVGRAKDMIIRGRHNVYPALHEPVAERVPGVRRCAMVGVWDAAAADERVVLAVEPDAPVQGEAARAALAARVGRALGEGATRVDDAARPDLVFVVDRLPEAGRSRKVDRAAVRALARAALGLPDDGAVARGAR